MPGEPLPNTPATFWSDYFWWPRRPQPAPNDTSTAAEAESTPRRTYRDALLANLPVATEHDALLHETYLFV